MREKDYYKDKYDYDKREKDQESASAGSKALAFNKNYNCLTLPSYGPTGGGRDSYEEKRKGCCDPRDFDTVWKKGGYDREDDSKESEAVASGKAAIFNKNINFVYRGFFPR